MEVEELRQPNPQHLHALGAHRGQHADDSPAPPMGHHRFTYTISPATRTSYTGTSSATGPHSSVPVRTSNCAKWRGHSTTYPVTLPRDSGARRCPQTSLRA